MTARVQYYVMIAGGQNARRPSGLARRTYESEGPVDETLRRDMTWQLDSAIVEWEYGDLGAELVKISEAEATHLEDDFGVRWGVPS